MSNFASGLKDFVHEWTLNIVILLFGITTLVQSFIVPTPSMDTTVMVGDHLLVDKLSYAPSGALSKYLLPYTEPKRGDVIVFRYPLDIRQNYVKRVMGVPGDHIHLVNKVVYLNGKALTSEPYTQHIDPRNDSFRDNYPVSPEEGADAIRQVGVDPSRSVEVLRDHVSNGELIVPPGFYFAMGDNRDNSLDSRYWGLVPRENIIGKPLVIFWSYDAPTEELTEDRDNNHYKDLALNFFSKTRWSRTLKLVRGIPVP